MIYFLRIIAFLLIFVVSYLFGSIPTGVIIGRVFYKKDPREYGSHNSGGTNTGRLFGKKAGLITILLDILKTIIPIITTFCLFTYVPALNNLMDSSSTANELNAFGMGNTLAQLTYYFSALSAIIGHGFSIFLKFEGGKVVSSYGASQLCYSYLTVPLFITTFMIILKLKKEVSRASLITGFCVVIFSWIIYIIYLSTYSIGNYAEYLMWFGYGPTCCIYYPLLMTIAYGLLFYKHRANIVRIKKGEENKITWMK